MHSLDPCQLREIHLAVESVGDPLLRRSWGRYRQIANDVVDEAPQIVFMKLHAWHVDTKRNVGGLVYRVLLCEIFDRIRDVKRRERQSDMRAQVTPRDPAPAPWLLDEMPAMLSDEDTTMILAWENPPMQVVALTLSGLWWRIQKATLQEILTNAGVDGDFPPDDWAEAAVSWEDKKARNRVLAEVLNARMNSVYKWWERGRIRLQSLPSIRRLMEALQ